MSALTTISYFFGGLFTANAAPHLVSAVMGRPFQTPFSKPPGRGLSSSLVNALWGFTNLVIAYLLTYYIGYFDLHLLRDAVALGAGILSGTILCALVFGRTGGGSLEKLL